MNRDSTKSTDHPCACSTRALLIACTAAVATATIESGVDAAPMGESGKNIVTLTYGEGYVASLRKNGIFSSLTIRLDDYPSDAGDATVTVTCAGQSIVAEWDPYWQEHRIEALHPSIAELKSALHGAYTINIAGVSSSESSFFFNAQALTADQIFSQPRQLTPSIGSVVAGTALMQWAAPLRGPTPNFITAYLNTDDSGLSPGGSVSWDPPGCISAGEAIGSVEYVAAAPPSLFTPLTVDTGSITWSTYSFMPPGFPTTGPAIGTVGSAATVFTSTGCNPSDLNGDGVVGAADLSLLLSAWGTPGPGDLDGDGSVGAADLALLLAAWG